MNIYVYSDESGVFDKKHNDIYVFAGVIAIGEHKKGEYTKKYTTAETSIRKSKKVNKEYELKATRLTNKEKGKLFRSTNNFYKFCVIIDQKEVLDRIFQSKKDKQRYLDYVYKRAIKKAFENLISEGIINPDDINKIYFYVDEHTTATNGRYELEQALEQEFKNGTYNSHYSCFYPPIFPKLKTVKVKFCNSQSYYLIRAADIIANKLYFLSVRQRFAEIKNISNISVLYQPKERIVE